ncbi:ABC transporter ATP-binding protein [Bosea sp. 62]|uniref:ATP-binding cassette domain-containing protein n=1 Tax=unclassified Bosea (in: a-proteobacteria) TaxID=2653178 RepID=UPI0012554C12|nr:MULTISPECIES: ATP-binding cassette domain-containing protein [unclassified Bosea (in: a-proteobacteria)]CAD5260786.1 ABC transporter ATP-binding protein [Bosea sp. 7B]CAD5271743.1 ABC transporter ATP-binding protein [Bosea sp. 21B]CAD5273942.1 ABC transporter ATP-binding protein [Bosea sp. 46]VVT56239.1 ABC transporter ATP-binding protein [Bosea sp. EC-HK365B]VXB62893.1 ABC transporter ATP-binding protein [Bosea sp. 62]
MLSVTSILPLTVEAAAFSGDGKLLVEPNSFTIPAGGLTVLLGPNGAGKSLTLRLCHGLLAPSRGAVRWAAGAEGRAKRHAMVFQKPIMLRRSVEANITHALAAAGANSTERKARAAQALQRFGLAERASQPARLLSGGEQQRLAIARAWALRPELLFLDEPTSQLDPAATRQIEELLSGLVAEGITVMMSTHDLGQARRLADRVLFLHRGRLVEDAPAREFFAGPQSAEARAFLAGELLW